MFDHSDHFVWSTASALEVIIPAHPRPRRSPGMTPRLPRHIVGRLLVIWGMLLPLIALPYTAAETCRVTPMLDIPFKMMGSRIGSLALAYEDILVAALVLIGLGVSFMVLPRSEPDRGG